MNNQEIADSLKKTILGEVRINEPMTHHTSFHIGGPADILVIPQSTEDVRKVLDFTRQKDIPLTVLGNGSNVLVRDKGIRGIVLKLGNALKSREQKGNRFTFGCGIALAQCSRIIGEAGFSGMEFAVGIPGSLGGALYMNAGAYGGEMKDIVEAVSYIDENGIIKSFKRDELNFSYRRSVFTDKEYIVTDVLFKLENKSQNEIREKMDELMGKRKSKQPLEYPSAGSTFKRPEGYFAGKLIEDAGLRGFRVGDAQVSEKHCGFVINRGNASAAEVMELMRQVEDKVEENSGVRLEAEVRRIGEF